MLFNTQNHAPALNWFSWLIACCSQSGRASAAATANECLPSSIADALADSALHLSPLTVEWRQRLETDGQKSEVANLLKRNEQEYFATEEHVESWQDGKIYWRYDYVSKSDASEFATLRQEFGFDGTIFAGGRPDTSLAGAHFNPLLKKDLIKTLAIEQPHARYFAHPYFVAAGYHLPTSMVELFSGSASSLVTYYLTSRRMDQPCSVEQTMLNGRNVLRLSFAVENQTRRDAENMDLEKHEHQLRSGPNSEEHIQSQLEGIHELRKLPKTRRMVFYLDPENKFAVRQREEEYDNHRTLVKCRCTDFQEVAGRSFWLPRKCVTEYFDITGLPINYSEKPLVREVIEVTAIRTDSLPDSRFVLDYGFLGPIVSDRSMAD
jgi:hypothetical protein